MNAICRSAFLVGFTALTVSCATVRVVSVKKGKGGAIAVHQGMIGESADEKAKRLMKENCGKKDYEIVEEGEAVVGSTSSGSEKQHKYGIKSSSTSTTNTTEWRVTYKCG